MSDESGFPKLRLAPAPRGGDRGASPDVRPAFQPTIHLEDIFREMIRSEVRNGRLSAWRRRRIVQYAAQLNLSAVEAGRMIDECRIGLAHPGDGEMSHSASRTDEAAPPQSSLLWNLAAIALGLTMMIAAFLMA